MSQEHQLPTRIAYTAPEDASNLVPWVAARLRDSEMWCKPEDRRVVKAHPSDVQLLRLVQMDDGRFLVENRPEGGYEMFGVALIPCATVRERAPEVVISRER